MFRAQVLGNQFHLNNDIPGLGQQNDILTTINNVLIPVISDRWDKHFNYSLENS
jgi:hypothetical protein